MALHSFSFSVWILRMIRKRAMFTARGGPASVTRRCLVPGINSLRRALQGRTNGRTDGRVRVGRGQKARSAGGRRAQFSTTTRDTKQRHRREPVKGNIRMYAAHKESGPSCVEVCTLHVQVSFARNPSYLNTSTPHQRVPVPPRLQLQAVLDASQYTPSSHSCKAAHSHHDLRPAQLLELSHCGPALTQDDPHVGVGHR